MAGGGSSTAGLASYKLDISAHLRPTEADAQDEDVIKSLNNDEDGFYYIPNFITEQEEEYLIEKVCTMIVRLVEAL
jgi:cellulose biosynthesis protein BcsQ